MKPQNTFMGISVRFHRATNSRIIYFFKDDIMVAKDVVGLKSVVFKKRMHFQVEI